jgi:molybdopterin molybdotransferase
MLTYQQAVSKIITYAKPKIIEISISHALHYVAAENIYSKKSNPNFDNSLLDGYAAKSSDIKKNKKLRIIAKLSAGENKKIPYTKNACFQVATGCPIQKPYDCMIPYEQVDREGNFILCKKSIRPYENIRKAGSDYKKKSLILPKGSKINASQLLAVKTLGITKIKVFAKPTIVLFCSGDEISDNPSATNKTINGISEYFNSFKDTYNYNFIYLGIVKDKAKDLQKIYNQLKKNKKENVIFVSTGGVSMGHKDFIPSMLTKYNYKIIFHRMNMKPGRPTLFARKNSSFYFGLPGNPISTIVGFHFLIMPLVHKLQNLSFQWKTGILNNNQSKNKKMSLFLRGSVMDKKINILPGQESYKISTLVKANCWVLLDQNKSLVKKGSNVKYINYEN